MIVTDEDDDTTTTFMTRTAYVRYHDITAWSLREGGGGKGRRTLPGDGSCLPPEFIVLRHVSSPFHPPIHPAFILLLRSLRATRLCLLFALSRFSCSLSLFSLSNPTHSPSSMPRCCTTPWFPLWLFSFTILIPLFVSSLFLSTYGPFSLSFVFSPVAPRFGQIFFSTAIFFTHCFYDLIEN